jgi:hypothetical protein
MRRLLFTRWQCVRWGVGGKGCERHGPRSECPFPPTPHEQRPRNESRAGSRFWDFSGLGRRNPLSNRKTAAYRLRVAVSPLSAARRPPSCPTPDPHRTGSAAASCRFVSAPLPTPVPNPGFHAAFEIGNRLRKRLIYMSIRHQRRVGTRLDRGGGAITRGRNSHEERTHRSVCR